MLHSHYRSQDKVAVVVLRVQFTNLLDLKKIYIEFFFWVSTVWIGSLLKTVRTACGQLRDTTNWRNFIGRCKTSTYFCYMGMWQMWHSEDGLHVELTCAATALAWSRRKANVPFSSLLRTKSKGSKERGRPFVTTWQRLYPFSWLSAYVLRYKAV